MRLLAEKVENIEAKGEIAGYQHFLFISCNVFKGVCSRSLEISVVC